MKKFLSALLIVLTVIVNAQTELVFVVFRDKPNKAQFYANPLTELSQKSLDRRARYGIALNDQDAPIEPTYIQNIKNIGFTVTDYSKWMNGVAVNATSEQITLLQSQSYVLEVERFIKHPEGNRSTPKLNKFETFNQTLGKIDFNYGSALSQINQINLRPLHQAGFTGTGITIAVIDTGFPTVNTGNAYARLRNNGQIKDGYNFINKTNDIYSTSLNNHGSYCLGVIAGYLQNAYVGSAPDADFYLYATEDAANEIPEEMIYWAEAAEEADRKGVDIITSSLGYYSFDDSRYDLNYEDMDGETSFIARVAQTAVEKGIFVLSAAGNEALNDWKYIITPADNAKVFTIGGVTSSGNSSSFSSHGPNASGYTKPDASARGTATAMAYNNSATTSNGTSFATPLAAGGVACLLQAKYTVSLPIVQEALRQTSSLYPATTPQMGYGILNFSSAWNNALLKTFENQQTSTLKIAPNPFDKDFSISTDEKILKVELYDFTGKKIISLGGGYKHNITNLSSGIYLLKITTDRNSYTEKIIKE